MDVLYPCTFCSETFTLRKYFLTHMENAHQSNVPLAINNFSRDPFICSMCSKQFMSKNLLRKHIILGHNKARKIRSNKVSYDLNNYLLLKVCTKHKHINYIVHILSRPINIHFSVLLVYLLYNIIIILLGFAAQ